MKTKNCSNLIFGTLLGTLLVASYQPFAIADDIFKRDYDFSTPIPATGKVTIRKPIQDLPKKSLFASCPVKSDLQDFAESTSFLVMICRDQKNVLQKYWIQKNKKTGSVLRLTAKDLPNSQPSVWKSGNYQVYLYHDGRNPQLINAYLESCNMKTKKGRAEALLYYYSKFHVSQ
ncbi:hypothetical protein PseudUWO311_20740 [Pseudanabaena sp. UWO311]|uniref:hypothetical protein n=1 Tax=Pseudanabaena sp. UWO311 TaxID=2487337 RepID=UPI00115B94E1|nr:hypothetical protein [Pseudanabaena sp. UWO311]TYQ23991.1 hypothetical protein PseudUWO311_20740 [Pseudanabaena sp. UWO311]